MNKYNNPRLLNTVVSGTGMKNPVRPHVIIGSEKNGFIRGDLMDANAVKEAVAKEVAERIDADLNLSEEIDTKVRQAVDDLVDGAPEVLDTLKELSEAIGDDENFITTMTEQLSEKVDKVEGKDLSTNDYTTAEKQKLAGIAAGAEVNVQADWNQTSSSNDAFIKNKPTKLSLFTNDVPYVTEAGLVDIQSDVDDLKEGIVFTTGPTNGHAYVDLGLPSGTLWATMNVGAKKESDYGLYFAWGETEGYVDASTKSFTLSDYKFNPSGDGKTMTKYNDADGKNVLEASDDAVAVAWGGEWHMPTNEQCQELIDGTTHAWTTIGVVKGYKFTSKSDNSKYIFIPAASYAYDGKVDAINANGFVWSSSRGTYYVPNASHLGFYSKNVSVSDDRRYYGHSVRGVLDGDAQVETTITPVKEVVTDLKSNEEVIAAALNDLNIRINAADQNLEDTQTSISDVESYIDEHEFVIADAITKLKTKLDEANIKLEDINSELEDIDAIRLRTIFTPAPVDPGETIQIFDGSSAIDELEDIVTNTNTRKFLTTVRGNKTLIVGFVDFFTDWAGHQITAVATSNIHLDEWDNESDLTLVPHTDGKANVYVAYCGLHDPAGYSGLVEGEWTRWKKFNTDRDDLNKVTSSLKNREYMDSSTFDAIFTESDSDAIDWIIDNFSPTFYVKDSSDNVITCSIVRSATAVCVTRNKVNNTTYTFINECRRGTIGSSGSINWSDWTTISSTVTPSPAA